MHRAFAAWLIAKPWRALLLPAVFGVFSPQGMSPVAVVAGAIPVLTVLACNTRLGLQAALTGSIAAGASLVAQDQSVAVSLLCVALLFFAPYGLAVLVRRTGSLRLSFQLAVLGAAALLVAIYVGFDDPVQRWQQLLAEAAGQLRQVGLIDDDQAVLKSLARTNWGTYVALWLLTVLGSLFLGWWWQSLVQAPGTFGQEFQQLCLGKVLGVIAVLGILAAFALSKLAINAPLIDAFVWVFTVALAYQGLAAAHRLKANGRVGKGWLTATYVLLIVPATMTFMVMLLAGWGVADNLRRQA